MKKRKLSVLMLSAILLTGCGETGTSVQPSTSESVNNEIMNVYDSYKANGGTLSYEEWLASIKGEKGDKGEDGMDGKDGKDGVNGKDGVDGKDGADGRSITGITKTSSSGNVDTYTITYSDGTTSTFTVNNGKDGKDGVDGIDGKDGETPEVTVGENGNWFVNGEDTGKKATIDVTEYIVTYSLDGGTLPSGYEMMVKVKTGECIFDLPTPTKTDYIFEGWYIGEGETEGKFTSTTPVTSDITLTAHWKSIYSQTFTVRWLNYDGTLLTTSEDVSYNTYPSYPGEENPTREPDDTYEYTFTGWSPSLTKVTKDCTYVAQFSKTTKRTSVTFDIGDKGTIKGNNISDNKFSCDVGDILYGYNIKIEYNDNANSQFVYDWYYDAELTKKVSFPIVVDDDITLYPKWENDDKRLNYYYESATQSYKVTSFKDTSSESIDTVTIPNVYDDGTNGSHPVTSIGEAFRNVKNVKSVVLPDSITKIAPYCFSYASVENVTLPSQLKELPDYCFRDCALKSIDIPDTCVTIGKAAFRGTQLTTVDLPDEMTEISSECFYWCRSLKTVDWPDNLETIKNSAFYFDSALTAIEFPDKLKKIEGSSFTCCSSLGILKLDDAIEEIEGFAFNGCGSLEKVVLKTSIAKIGYTAFGDCSNLTVFVEAESLPTDWDENFAKDGTSVVYYRESYPGSEDGTFWHYVDGIPTLW